MASPYPYFLVSPGNLAAAKRAGPALEPALEQLYQEAEEAHALPVRSVMDKPAAGPSGDKHDYISYGPYWWPDPDKPDGLPYIRRDGEVNPESQDATTDRAAMDAMAESAETLALAYYYGGDARYRDNAAGRLATWFLNPATRMNPHLGFAQAIRGVTEGRGIGIIDTVVLTRVVNAATILGAADALPQDTGEGLRRWFGDYLGWLLTSGHGRNEAHEHNNHGTWYDAQTALFAWFTGDGARARGIIETSAKERLATHIAADGSQPHELARTRSFSYSVYNLCAFVMLAMLGEKLGADLWRVPDGGDAFLRRAVDFLAPYVSPSKPWPYRQIGGANRAGLLMVLPAAGDVYGDAGMCAGIAKETLQRHRIRLLYPVAAGLV